MKKTIAAFLAVLVLVAVLTSVVYADTSAATSAATASTAPAPASSVPAVLAVISPDSPAYFLSQLIADIQASLVIVQGNKPGLLINLANSRPSGAYVVFVLNTPQTMPAVTAVPVKVVVPDNEAQQPVKAIQTSSTQAAQSTVTTPAPVKQAVTAASPGPAQADSAKIVVVVPKQLLKSEEHKLKMEIKALERYQKTMARLEKNKSHESEDRDNENENDGNDENDD